MANNPAKFTNSILDVITDKLIGFGGKYILDPFGGSGKIALIKKSIPCYIHCNDIENGWKEDYPVDKWYHQDAQTLDTKGLLYDAIVTSPTYGNRMADHHNAKDASKRITYTHRYGAKLTEGNTGVLHFGNEYKNKHVAIFRHLLTLLKDGSIVMVNVSDFIRKGEVVGVVSWWKDMLEGLGLAFIEEVQIKTPRMRFGANNEKRVEGESLLVFKKVKIYEK
jgi:hypothetical protein